MSDTAATFGQDCAVRAQRYGQPRRWYLRAEHRPTGRAVRLVGDDRAVLEREALARLREQVGGFVVYRRTPEGRRRYLADKRREWIDAGKDVTLFDALAEALT